MYLSVASHRWGFIAQLLALCLIYYHAILLQPKEILPA